MNSVLSRPAMSPPPLTHGPIEHGADATSVYAKVTEGKNVAITIACGSGTSWSVQVSGRARLWERANTADLLRTCLIAFVAIALPVPRGIAGAVVAISIPGGPNVIFALSVTTVIRVPTTLTRRNGMHL